MSSGSKKGFIVKGRNTGFTCQNCGAFVSPHESSVRNHCTECLWSLHVDEEYPGDRKSLCKGTMKPTGYAASRQGYDIEHCCTVCSKLSTNKAAPDDSTESLLKLPGVTTGRQ